MTRIVYRTFDGLVPRREPALLDENAAQIAKDVDLRRGVLTPVLGLADDTRAGATGLFANSKAVYLWHYTDWTLTTDTLGTTTPGTWAAVASAGKFKITLDDVVYECSPVLGSCSTMAAVATALQTAIRAQTSGVERVVYVAAAGAVGAHFVFYANAVIKAIAAPASGTNLAAAGFLNGPGTDATVESERWLEWQADVNVVNGPVNDDPYSRIYFTGDGLPKMTMRIAGETVTRSIKIEAPTVPPVAGTAYSAPADSDVRALFVITGARVVVQLNGNTVYQTNMAFTRSGDTVTVANGKYSGSGIGTWRFAVDLLVNGKWEGTGFYQTGAMTHSVVDPSGEYKIVLDYVKNGGWAFNWVTLGAALSLTWGGAIKLYYYNADGTAIDGEAEDDSVAVSYCASFVTDLGEEGPPSDATAVYLSNSTDPITLGDAGTLPAPVDDTTRGIVALRLYRAAGGVFRFLADVPLTTSPYEYEDATTTDDSNLGEVLPDDTANPPDDLQGLISCAGGWYAGFRGRELLASEPFVPTSWPAGYRTTKQSEIVALASAGNDIFVLTEGRPEIGSGSTPDLLTFATLESDQACVSATGVAMLGQTVLYPSPDGLVAMYAGAARLVTADWYRREDWQALVPASIRAAVHDGRYYASLNGLASPYMLIVDFSESVDRVTTATADVAGVYSDLLSDQLYVIEDAPGGGTRVVRKWRGGATVSILDWQGRDWLFPKPVAFTVLRVLADAYVTPAEGATDTRPLVTLYANGVSTGAYRITGSGSVRLPRLRPERRWSLRVQSGVEVTEIILSTSMGAQTR